MANLINTIQEMAKHIFAVYDNGGETYDRYSVCFTDLSVLGLSGEPSGPLGFSQFSECNLDYVMNGSDSDKRILFTDLPKNVQEHVIARTNQGYSDYLEDAMNENDFENMRREIMSEWEDAKALHGESVGDVI